MNTKQFLVLGLSFALVANMVAMEETPAQQARRLREEATQRRIAQLRAEQDAKKKPATRPVAPRPATIPTTDLSNNNNSTERIAAIPSQPVITRPVVKAEVPKGKEEADTELSAAELLKDRARKLQIRNQLLEDTNNNIAAYAQVVRDKSLETLVAEITHSSAKARIAEQKASCEAGLQLIEDRYAQDAGFVHVKNALNTMVDLLNLQEQILDNVIDQDSVKNKIDTLILANNGYVRFSQALVKLQVAYMMACAAIKTQPAPIDDESANEALIAQLANEDAEQAARELEMLEATLKHQEEQESIARGIADAQLARQIQMELDGNNATGSIDENVFVAEQLAREEREAAEQASMLAALALNEESQPAVDNDAFLAIQMAEQLRDEERAALEAASLELARRLQNEQ